MDKPFSKTVKIINLTNLYSKGIIADRGMGYIPARTKREKEYETVY